ncbi:serine arginine-rich splicing factor, partial [Goodea atripinnis]
ECIKILPCLIRRGEMSYYSSSRSSSRATDCKVYVGDLGNGAAKGELERAFSYYGPLRTVWVARNPPGFAFVEFEDPRDAEDAVKGMDGKILCGSRVRVEMSTGLSRKGRGRPSRRQFDPNDRCYQCGDRGHYAYDCYRYSKRGRRSSRSRGRRYRSRSHSRSRSYSRYVAMETGTPQGMLTNRGSVYNVKVAHILMEVVQFYHRP